MGDQNHILYVLVVLETQLIFCSADVFVAIFLFIVCFTEIDF